MKAVANKSFIRKAGKVLNPTAVLILKTTGVIFGFQRKIMAYTNTMGRNLPESTLKTG